MCLGKIISIGSSLASTVGVENPMRYRGYYYDTETGLYYLQSRYYNPDWGRFISQDEAQYHEGMTGAAANLYAYGNNNPVMMSDPSGHWVASIGLESTIAIGFGLYGEVAINIDQSLNISVTWTAGIITIINGVVNIAGYIAFYPFKNSVLQLNGFGVSIGVSYDFGVHISGSGCIDFSERNVGCAGEFSVGAGASLVPIPSLMVKMSYTGTFFNMNLLRSSNLSVGKAITYTGLWGLLSIQLGRLTTSRYELSVFGRTIYIDT